jgi:tetratricopeptide (TPR) repeat protein
MKEMTPQAQVEELLRRGLDFYALNKAQEAARCWEEAARIDPSDPRAAEYLTALNGDGGGGAEEPETAPERVDRRSLTGLREVVDELAEPQAAPRSFDRARFVELLRNKQFEEALEALYRMRLVAPDNASVSRGIQVLKDKLLDDYLARLGNLDLIVVQGRIAGPVAAEEQDVLRLVDGIASLGDVLNSSRLGRFATARALSAMLERGVVVATGREPSTEPDEPKTPAAGRVTSRYDEVFRLATEAYLRRDVDTALTLFTQCLEERPNDRRVQHNIERLEQRKRNS